MQNSGNATLYHHYFYEGQYKCTSIAAIETAKQYRLLCKLSDVRMVKYLSIVKKDDLDKLIEGTYEYEMFSTKSNIKLFSALLFDSYKTKRGHLLQKIAEIDKEMQIIAAMGQ